MGQNPDLVVWKVARGQHGIVSRVQLLRAGLTRHQISSRLADNRLFPVHAGVYQVGPMLTDLGRLMAALLACGPRAVLSHLTAAWLWNIQDRIQMNGIWVTVPPGESARRPGLNIVRAELDPRDIRRHRGLAVTSPPRTALDCAQPTEFDSLEWMLSEAAYRGYAREGEMFDQLARNPGKRGNTNLRALMERPGGVQRARRGAERAFMRLLRDERIDGFEANAAIDGYEVDFLWRALRFGVEVDGYDAHASRQAFERDRLKRARLQANGLTIMPVTGRQIRDDNSGVVERLHLALSEARDRLRPPR